MRDARVLGSSARVPMWGPLGEKVSHDFPRVHWPSANCQRLSETSLKTTYPATYAIASSCDTAWAFAPMTSPNSPSKSTCACLAGKRIGSNGPERLEVNFAKHNGELGIGCPASFA